MLKSVFSFSLLTVSIFAGAQGLEFRPLIGREWVTGAPNGSIEQWSNFISIGSEVNYYFTPNLAIGGVLVKSISGNAYQFDEIHKSSLFSYGLNLYLTSSIQRKASVYIKGSLFNVSLKTEDQCSSCSTRVFMGLPPGIEQGKWNEGASSGSAGLGFGFGFSLNMSRSTSLFLDGFYGKPFSDIYYMKKDPGNHYASVRLGLSIRTRRK